MMEQAPIPMKLVGPVKIIGPEVNDDVMLPIATYETPMWASTGRGAKVSRLSGGIHAVVIQDTMSRSICVEAANALEANQVALALTKTDEVKQVVESSSRYAKFDRIDHQIVGNLLYLRLSIQPGDASGHNMVTKAADVLMQWLLETYPSLQYVSISGNYCTDKKVSAVNGILGRGKNVVAEITIPNDICQKVLKTTPQAIVDLHIKKNLLGTMIAGGLRTANAHFANQLLAMYLATGQDAANIVEGSQGFVHCEVRDGALYFSVTIPNIIVGTVGNGKHLDFVQKNLEQLGCLEQREPGANSRRLAIIIASGVLCVELSLLAALTNPGELMHAHTVLERQAAQLKE